MSEAPGVECRDLASRGCLNLRGDADDPGFRDAVATALGLEPPIKPCSWHHAGDARAYWLGPDEWLLIVPDGEQSKLEQRMRDAVRGRLSVADVSGGLVHLNLAGADAGKVLQKSSPYDFHPRHFPPGRCVQTVFAKASALVAANADGSFDLVIRRSYTDYLSGWIADAAEEYGYAVRRP